MTRIVDVVNFNADASCLSSQRWLSILNGGSNSLLANWLKLYMKLNKKVVIGFPGATVADIAVHNRESIDIINDNPEIFEIILRPFAHDIALLRVGNGFLINFEYGRKVINEEFRHICNYYLPPEFMLTNEQLALLCKQQVEGVFINSSRFSSDMAYRIPSCPYHVHGLFGATVQCIPFVGNLTSAYLHALQNYDCSIWNRSIDTSKNEILFSWRDGESSFLLPNSIEREAMWLNMESKNFKREHIHDLKIDFVSDDGLEDYIFKSYPVHSFSAWMKEFRMLGFINRINAIESNLNHLSDEQVRLWLQIINSDILSAIEKEPPIVQLKNTPEVNISHSFTLQRSERGFEGEEFLSILEHAIADSKLPKYVSTSQEPHLLKWRGRMEYLYKLQKSNIAV
jgi:hypothetical protein